MGDVVIGLANVVFGSVANDMAQSQETLQVASSLCHGQCISTLRCSQHRVTRLLHVTCTFVSHEAFDDQLPEVRVGT
ncbi:hypothetical protein D3C81_2087630 [compost metagenome]